VRSAAATVDDISADGDRSPDTARDLDPMRSAKDGEGG